MTLMELNTKIINFESLPNVLVFIGPEWSIKESYIKEIARTPNLELHPVQSLHECLVTKSFGFEDNIKKLYVCKYDNESITKDDIIENLTASLKDNQLILILDTIDKRLKFYKEFESGIVEFNNEYAPAMPIMINAICDLPRDIALEISELCDNCYSLVKLECYNIHEYATLANISDEASYKYLMNNNFLYSTQSANVNDFVYSIMTKSQNSLKMYNLIRNGSKSTMFILACVYAAVRTQLIVQTSHNPTAQSTGLNYYILQEAIKRPKVYSNDNLMYILNLLYKVELDFKAGLLDDNNLIDYVITRMYSC